MDRFRARVYLVVASNDIHWTQPIRTGRSLLRRAFDAANKISDLTFAAYSFNNLVTRLLASGDPLAEVQREAEAGLEFARQAQFDLVIDFLTGQNQLIRTLRRLTPKFGAFDDTAFDEGRFERRLEQDPHVVTATCWYSVRKLQARVHLDGCHHAEHLKDRYLCCLEDARPDVPAGRVG